MLRSGLRWLLTRVAWVERCAGAASVEEALALTQDHDFDLALVDVGLGLAACERLSSAVPCLALLASRWDHVPMRTARAVGARGVIAKEAQARELFAAVRELARGGACEPAPAAPGEVRFAPREREILRLVSAGLTNAEIGATLFLAPGTIKHHMLELFEKLGAPNRAAAVHTARRLGLLADRRQGQPVEDEPGGRPVRVLVADARDVRRAGVLLALHGRAWVADCRGARSSADALTLAAELEPDIALVADPLLSRALVAADSGMRTLLLRDEDGCPPALLRDAEASGTVLQWWTSERVADAVRRACRGPRAAVASAPDPVSPREMDVLTAFAAGATNPAIARELGLSPNTVKQHASSIFRKLGVRNRAEAVRRADELGLLAA